MKKYLILCLFLSASTLANVHLANEQVNGSVGVASWKELRDKDIEKQDKDFSCGSAAAATILRSFYGKEVYEKDILTEVFKYSKDGMASFADLQKAVKKFGFKAVGVSLSFEQLKQLKIPAIVYLRHRKLDHFSVIRGVNENGLVLLGDPSWGNRKFSEYQFKDMWETREDANLKGKILLVIPEDQSLAHLNKSFFYAPKHSSVPIELLTIRR